MSALAPFGLVRAGAEIGAELDNSKFKFNRLSLEAFRSCDILGRREKL